VDTTTPLTAEEIKDWRFGCDCSITDASIKCAKCEVTDTEQKMEECPACETYLERHNATTMLRLLNAQARAGEELDTELGRWQDAIRDVVIDESGAPDGTIDGGGCESGDPLDLSLAEIRLGFAYMRDVGRK
jgi:hypothetical protein